jgi:2-dehydro-3-deoxyphosphogalactonate aldolase
MTIQAFVGAETPPLVAILRGLSPAEALGIGRALLEGGIRMMEVPLNSPQPLASIALLSEAFGNGALIGAGTVMSVREVNEVAAAGVRLVVSPHTDAAVIGRAVALGLECLPGFFTATEAFAALAAGATELKLFPAARAGPGYLKALRDVLPRTVGLWAVGGTGAHDLVSWLEAGAAGIGVGGALYRPGDGAALVRQRAQALHTAWQRRGGSAGRAARS